MQYACPQFELYFMLRYGRLAKRFSSFYGFTFPAGKEIFKPLLSIAVLDEKKTAR